MWHNYADENVNSPERRSNSQNIDDDLDDKERVFVYLEYMVRMTSFMEKCGLKGKKLYYPVPLKTSFIPAHYTSHLNAIADLRAVKK